MEVQHPMQPIVLDPEGTHRFKENKIIRLLIDAYPNRLNGLGMVADSTSEDWCQLMQLIGYSVSGWGDLRCVRPEDYASAAVLVEQGGDPRDAHIAVLQNELASIRRALSEPIATLYGMHPADLLERCGLTDVP